MRAREREKAIQTDVHPARAASTVGPCCTETTIIQICRAWVPVEIMIVYAHGFMGVDDVVIGFDMEVQP